MMTKLKYAVWSVALAAAFTLSAGAQAGEAVGEAQTSLDTTSLNLEADETIRLLLEEFREKAAEYAAQQKELQKNWKERNEIRQAMKANRDAFKSARAEFRDGVKELTETLRGQARKIAEEHKSQARQNRGRE